jgi:hypothetical protein
MEVGQAFLRKFIFFQVQTGREGFKNVINPIIQLGQELRTMHEALCLIHYFQKQSKWNLPQWPSGNHVSVIFTFVWSVLLQSYLKRRAAFIQQITSLLFHCIEFAYILHSWWMLDMLSRRITESGSD